VSLSRTSFLTDLKSRDYLKFGNIAADWPTIVDECEAAVKEFPQYWSSLVVDPTTFAWDKIGEEYAAELEKNRTWGYTPENTRSWTTLATKPQLTMEWEEGIANQLPLTNWISRPTMQTPGNVMPWHCDNFYYFKRNYPNQEFVIRFVIFMQDWQIGHVLQAGDSIISHWKAGDVIVWHPERMHLSANIGYNNKWTINTTGILKEEYENTNT
jgi:hypothetical protein